MRAAALLLLSGCVSFVFVQGPDPSDVDLDPVENTTTGEIVATIASLSTETIRQGGGGELVVTGEHLDLLSGVTFSDPAITGSLTGDKVTVQVAHGAAPMTYSVTLGDQTFPAVTVSEITVSTNGDDTGAGTTVAPFRTLSHALSVSDSGDTVRLSAGEFGAGEAFPQLDGDTDTARAPVSVPAGVRVKGDPLGTTLRAPIPDDRRVAFVTGGAVTLENLVITGFRHGVVALSGAVTLGHVDIHSSGVAGLALLDAGAANVSSSSLGGNGRAGVLLASAGALTLTDVQLIDNGPPDTSIPATLSGGIVALSDGDFALGAITLLRVTSSGNNNKGFAVQNAGALCVVTITDSTFEDNNDNALWLDGNNYLLARGSHFSQLAPATGSRTIRFQSTLAQDGVRWDFGSTSVNPGAVNTFKTNTNGYIFTDDRTSANMGERLFLLTSSSAKLVDTSTSTELTQAIFAGSYENFDRLVVQENDASLSVPTLLVL